MTGFTTRISSLRDGEIEQFKKDLAAAGLGGHHIRDFIADKTVLRAWVKDGIDRLEQRWARSASHIPHSGWERIGDTVVWIRLYPGPYPKGEEEEVFAVQVGTNLDPNGVQVRVLNTVNLRHTKWKEVVGGVQIRRWGSNGVEIRVPAPSEYEKRRGLSLLATDGWGPERKVELCTGVLASIGDGLEANLWGPSQPHECLLCSSEDVLVVKLSKSNATAALHLPPGSWRSIGDNTQVRPDPSARNTIWVRNRKN